MERIGKGRQTYLAVTRRYQNFTLISMTFALLIIIVKYEDINNAFAIDTTTSSNVTGTITKVIDGNTLDVNGKMIQLAMVHSIEKGDPRWWEAVHFISVVCPVHSPVVVDPDDNNNNQKFPFSNNMIIVAVVYCGGVNLNEAILDVKLATIDSRLCYTSEFADEEWIKANGC